MKKSPSALDAITDVVLAYRPADTGDEPQAVCNDRLERGNRPSRPSRTIGRKR